MDFRGYKDLECYKKARELRILVSVFANKFPAHEKFLLAAQIKDASRSISANISEGYGRYTYADTKNFFIISRGSVCETMEHLQTAHDENYLTIEEFSEGANLCEHVFKLVNGYISYLNKQHSIKKI